MKLSHPLPNGIQTDRFGPRGHIPGIGDLGFHYGNDWYAPAGTAIRAAHDGVVRIREKHPIGGNLIYLTGDGVETSYQHMRTQAIVAPGQHVTAGQTIGYVGSTGASTGDHLHFEQWVNGLAWQGGTPVDPLKYIENDNAEIPRWEEEEDDMRPTIHFRTEGTQEWTRCHPDIGKTLKPGTSRKDGNVMVYRGFEATSNKTVGTAWARQYAGGSGYEHSRTDRAGYVAIQKQATRLSVEVHG